MITLSETQVEELKKTARSQTWFDVSDSATDNGEVAGEDIDAAYYSGRRDGRIQAARILLSSLGIAYK